MNRIRSYTMLAMVIAFAVACANNKNQKTDETSTMANEEKMMQDGYTKARVVFDEEADQPCDYLLVSASGDQVMEPLEFPTDFKEADLNVWIKYVPQRRQGRCGDVLPIELTEIKKRTKN
ncbi:hypothetical protein [Halocola ammonii]